MVTPVESQMELIPGYRLLELLGRGGFGEVWKAQAPGGLLKAVKIVHGCLGAAGDDEACVRQELKALERVKAVRHPFILSLERFDIIDGRLIIVMELADRSLWDRFQECRSLGLPGIPRDELLPYMEETAEALDLMNNDYHLQHLDIKPQNLFLLYNHVKVGDFGLVKDMVGLQTKATSGVTVAYASPEIFQGVISRFCDQYNLAVVYQELLTGQLPFKGTTPQQMMFLQLTGSPDLSPLPPADREPIGRALAKKPEDRYPTCGALIRALNHGREAGSPSDSGLGLGSRPTNRVNLTPASVVGLENTSVRPPERNELTGDGVLRPALVISVGGLGLRVVQQFRKALHQHCGLANAWPHIRLLHLDTDPDVVREATQGGPDAALKENEVLLARLQRPAQYLRTGREREAIQPWFPVGLLSRLPRDQVTPCGRRALGRLALCTNYSTIIARLRTELEACIAPEALTSAQRQTGLGMCSNFPRVYVVTSLAGGTGAGMFLDLAYGIRRLLKGLGYASPQVVGLFLLPPAGHGSVSQLNVVNAFAALTELNHFANPGVTFAAGYVDHEGMVIDAEAPFSRCLLLPLPKETEGAGPLGELISMAGDYLSWDLATPLGRTADEARADTTASSSGISYQTFGAFWFTVPRRPLLQRVAQRLCQRLVQGWQSAEHLEEAVNAWVAGQMACRELTPEAVTARLHADCIPILGQDPAKIFDALIGQPRKGKPVDLSCHPETVDELFEELERLVGSPMMETPVATPLALEEALEQAARALIPAFIDSLSEIALEILSAPQFRLIGADAAVGQRLTVTLTEGVREHTAAADRHEGQIPDLYQKALLLRALLSKSSRWWGNRAKVAADLQDALRRYYETGFQVATLRQVSTIYQHLLDSLPQYLREVNCCRPRIAQFLQSIAGPATKGQTTALGLGQYLLPGQCRTLDDGAGYILSAMTPEEMLDLNQKVQGMIGKRFQKNIHVCTAPATFFKDLEEAVYGKVASFAEAQLTKAHAAEVFLEQHTKDETMLSDLTGAFDEAIPELVSRSRSARNELCILAVPSGAEGERFRVLVNQAMPDQRFIPAASTNDIVFYREQPNLELFALAQLGPGAQAMYSQFLATEPFPPHSRLDIANWLPVK